MGFIIVGEGGTKDDAVRISEELRPDVILMDISMPGGGIDVIPLILDRVPNQKIVMLTVSEASDDVSKALSSGAKGYALKGVGSKALADIVAVWRGKKLCCTKPLGPPDLGTVRILRSQTENAGSSYGPRAGGD